MTSNVGAAALTTAWAEGEEGFEDAKTRVMDALRQQFRPEFLNRIDDIVVFHPLAEDQLTHIVDLRLKDLQALLADRKITLELTEAARHAIFTGGYDRAYGARPLKARHSADGAGQARRPHSRRQRAARRSRDDRRWPKRADVLRAGSRRRLTAASLNPGAATDTWRPLLLSKRSCPGDRASADQVVRGPGREPRLQAEEWLLVEVEAHHRPAAGSR